jgi:hypothetical protein
MEYTDRLLVVAVFTFRKLDFSLLVKLVVVASNSQTLADRELLHRVAKGGSKFRYSTHFIGSHREKLVLDVLFLFSASYAVFVSIYEHS